MRIHPSKSVFLVCIMICMSGAVFPGTRDIAMKNPGYLIERYDLGQTKVYPYGATVSIDLSTYSEAWSITAGGTVNAKSGDIDGDGSVDLVYTDDSSLVALNGEGTEILRMSTTAKLGILGDLNGDDAAEIFLYKGEGYTGYIYVYNSSSALIQQFSSDITPAQPGRTALDPRALVDIDGDGDLELIARKGAGYSLQPRGVVAFDCDTATELWYYNMGPSPIEIAAADISGDSPREIVFSTGAPANGSVGSDGSRDSLCYTFCLDGVTGTRLWRNQYEGSGFVDSSVNVADIDGDGNVDVVAGSHSHGWDAWGGSYGRIYILDPQTGAKLVERNFGHPVWMGGLADLDNDGNLEIIVLEKNSSTHVGAVTILSHQLATEYTLQYPDEIPDAQVITDINGDGFKEIIIFVGHRIEILNGSLQVLRSIPIPSSAYSCFVSDLDSDGGLEIIVPAGPELHVYSPSFPDPLIAVSPTSFTKTCPQADGVCTDTLLVWNGSYSGTLEYEIATSPSWLSCLPTTGSSRGGVNTHVLTIDPSGLTAGFYAGTVTITALAHFRQFRGCTSPFSGFF